MQKFVVQKRTTVLYSVIKLIKNLQQKRGLTYAWNQGGNIAFDGTQIFVEEKRRDSFSFFFFRISNYSKILIAN